MKNQKVTDQLLQGYFLICTEVKDDFFVMPKNITVKRSMINV